MHHKEKLEEAMKFAIEHKPKVGGFPYLAETLRRAGVSKNIWHLPSLMSIYLMNEGSVVMQGTPLVSGMHTISKFDKELLIRAIRSDQAGESTFPEFLQSAWNAGVIRYEVDFDSRNVTYYGVSGEHYVESYPQVEISN